MDLSTPLGIERTIHCGRDRSTLHGVLSVFVPLPTFDVLLQTDLLITRLCCDRGFVIMFRSGPVPGTLVPTRQISSAFAARHSIGICQTAVLRESFTIFRTRARLMLCILEF